MSVSAFIVIDVVTTQDHAVEGVKERMEFEQAQSSSKLPKASTQSARLPPTSRRRKGTVFLF